MNINQLKLFYLTAKHASLSVAAQELGITQPAVSKGIQRLQEQHGVKLLDFEGRQMRLTEAGEEVYGIAEKIFELEAVAEERLARFGEEAERRIHLQTCESFGAYYLPSIINRYAKLHPEVSLTVDVLPTGQVAANTIALKNDLGFLAHEVRHHKLRTREICREDLVVIAPPGHPLTKKKSLKPADLLGQAMIMHEEGSATRRAVDVFLEAHELRVVVPMTLGSNEAVKQAVTGGAGVAVLSLRVAEKEVELGLLHALALPGMTRAFYLVYHLDKTIHPPLQALIDLIEIWTFGR